MRKFINHLKRRGYEATNVINDFKGVVGKVKFSLEGYIHLTVMTEKDGYNIDEACLVFGDKKENPPEVDYDEVEKALALLGKRITISGKEDDFVVIAITITEEGVIRINYDYTKEDYEEGHISFTTMSNVEEISDRPVMEVPDFVGDTKEANGKRGYHLNNSVQGFM